MNDLVEKLVSTSDKKPPLPSSSRYTIIQVQLRLRYLLSFRVCLHRSQTSFVAAGGVSPLTTSVQPRQRPKGSAPTTLLSLGVESDTTPWKAPKKTDLAKNKAQTEPHYLQFIFTFTFLTRVGFVDSFRFWRASPIPTLHKTTSVRVVPTSLNIPF